MVGVPVSGLGRTSQDDSQTRELLAISVTRSMVLAATLLAALLAPLGAVHAEQAKQASIVVDANTGKVLHAQSADELRFPASLTKMMTLYILFGEIQQGRLTYDSKIPFSEHATSVAPSKLGADVGDEITVLEAIRALVVKSANDVAVAVAEKIGGSEVEFARIMTERARQIGMTSSIFRNASGLPNPAQRTTARDMVTLGIRLQDDYPEQYKFFSTASFTFRGKTHKTHNSLMLGFPGMDGIKTGYTRLSGFNLVSSVHADGKHVVGAVFGGKTAATRNALMRSLLFTSLQKASTEKTRQSGPQLIARARPVERAPEPENLAWATTPKKSPPEKKPPAKVAQAAQTAKAPPAAAPPPAPERAQRAAPAEPKHDQIAAVLAQGEGDAANSSPRLDLQALRAAMSDGGAEQTAPQTLPPATPAPMQAAAAPSARDIAGLIRNSIVEGTPEAPARAVPVSETSTIPATTGAPVARQPSTLNSQANALTAYAAAPAATAAGDNKFGVRQRVVQSQVVTPPSHLRGPPDQPTAAPRAVGYEIQIGAYGNEQDARAKLSLVRDRATKLLTGHEGVTLAVERDNKQFYRARFVQFDESGASNACLELRRMAIDCFVMKAD